MPILHADPRLTARIEVTNAEINGRYAAAYDRLFPGERAGSEQIGSAIVTFAGAGSPLNRTTALGVAGPVAERDLERSEQFLTGRGAVARIDLCPLADESLTALLRGRGYRIDYFLNVNVIALRPAAADAAATTEPAAECGSTADLPVVTHLAPGDPDAADLWADTVGAGFADHGPASPDVRSIYLTTYGCSECWLASIGGRVAGGGALRIVGTTALLSTASTIPQFRRRGVQAALMRARLAAARRAGCDLAIVMTTPGSDSERNVTRLGFRTLYTDACMIRVRTDARKCRRR